MLPILAPILGTLLSNGLDLLANAALAKGKEYVEEKTGVKLDKPLSPEDVTKLKLAQMEHEIELKRIRQEDDRLTAHLEEMYIQDRQDARSRDVEIVKVKGNNRRGDVLAYGSLATLASCLFMLFFVDVDNASRDLLLVMLGALVTIVKDVFSFEFGSSKDSQRNAQAVADMLKGD
jgi:hypothetical protein